MGIGSSGKTPGIRNKKIVKERDLLLLEQGKEINRQKETIEELKNEIKRINFDVKFQREQAAEIQSLKQELDAANKAYKIYFDERKDLIEENNKMTGAIMQYESEISSLKQENEELKEEIDKWARHKNNIYGK